MAIDTEKEALELVGTDGLSLENIPDSLKTRAVCLSALGDDGDALRYVPTAMQTASMARLAVRSRFMALRFVREDLLVRPSVVATVRSRCDPFDSTECEMAEFFCPAHPRFHAGEELSPSPAI